jgi:hypothetical protein
VSGLSADAERLLAALTGSRTRWPLDDLEGQYLRAAPHMRERPERRRELAALLDELAEAGSVRPSVRQDRTAMPPLPLFVDVVAPASGATGRPEARGRRWRPELAGVLALQPRPTPAELRVLRQVDRWLVRHGDRAPAAGSRERSLAVFADERLLDDRLRHSRLFTSGLLSDDLLRARRIAPGLVTERVGGAPGVLVVESPDTFRAVAGVLAGVRRSPVGLVAWGAGIAFEQSCEALLGLTVPGAGAVRRCWYFGSIDPGGLRIPARAAALVAPLPLHPARPLYELLLDRDRRAGGRERMHQDTRAHLRWLGEPLAARARSVLASHSRLPQEALTAEVLHAYGGPLV